MAVVDVCLCRGLAFPVLSFLFALSGEALAGEKDVWCLPRVRRREEVLKAGGQGLERCSGGTVCVGEGIGFRF